MRIELVCYINYMILFYYDFMVVKFIVYEFICEELIMIGICVLSEYFVLGIDIMILFYLRFLNNYIFRSGEFNIKFLEKYNIMDDNN